MRLAKVCVQDYHDPKLTKLQSLSFQFCALKQWTVQESSKLWNYFFIEKSRVIRKHKKFHTHHIHHLTSNFIDQQPDIKLINNFTAFYANKLSYCRRKSMTNFTTWTLFIKNTFWFGSLRISVGLPKLFVLNIVS